MKPIPQKAHALLDYGLVLLLCIAAASYDFSSGVAAFTFVLAALQLMLALATNYSGGLAKIIPFRAHGSLEMAIAIVLIVSPWLLTEAVPADRYFYTAYGFALLAIALLTDYKSGKPMAAP